MAQSWIIVSIVLTYCLLEVSPRPSDNESSTAIRIDPSTDVIDDVDDDENFPREQIRFSQDDDTQDILNKINVINQGLIKPNRNRNKNSQSHTVGSYVLDAETLKKIQQIIAAGKLNAYTDVQREQGIKDPLLGFLHGGGWNNFFEYGQNADVCNRKQKAIDDEANEGTEIEVQQEDEPKSTPEIITNTREARAIRKRTVSTVAPQMKVQDDSKKFSHKNLQLWGYWRRLGRGREITGYNQQPQEYQYDGRNFIHYPAIADSTFTLYLNPIAHAMNGPRGTAIANPVSHVIIGGSQKGSIVFNPVASAVVGPGGIAHAQSDLYFATVQYLPFYGGGKGQYLEVKTNNRGVVVSETIVSEENISSENIVKNIDENLLSKVLAKNLQNLQSLSSNLIKLHNLGRKTGTLSGNDKERFKTQLASLGETTSNTIKLIEEIGTNVDVLFRSGSKRQYEEEDIVLTYCLLEVSPRPSDNESSTPIRIDPSTDVIDDVDDDENFPREQIRFSQDDDTQDILNKINVINQGLIKPNRNRNKNSQSHTVGSYVLDAETLKKIQQIIAAGKLNAYTDVQREQGSNSLLSDHINESRYDSSRALQYSMLPADLIGANQIQSTSPRVPYLTSIPVLVMPSQQNNLYDRYTQNTLNSIESDSQIQTRQRPPISLPFNINWPLAPFFPILVKDPLLGFLHGGGWNNFFEYGQNADVCNRKQKAIDDEANEGTEIEVQQEDEPKSTPEIITNTREARAIRKRTVSTVAPQMKVQDDSKKFFSQKPTVATVTKPKPASSNNAEQGLKTVPKDDDLRFHLGGFSLFGGRPTIPSPGFFINKLKVRRGGVAIAGPGGVATAGRGGAAIVGPGGLAYTQPGGLAVAGPSSRVVALTSDVDLSSIVTRLQQQQAATDGSVPRLLEAIPEGKIVAIGPTIYYHPE
ncbi:hypothetical protein MSG28_007464 [Choristoneura fumiferana]|uniref:Uncharacterized protein n=1 Tax=Choristoneura fumiferana TaxID=7141 RepID=A0ACC0JXM4_CHOFU|nr:hypothetical protein MSG28_007464 [Choristoneura fumiferana]